MKKLHSLILVILLFPTLTIYAQTYPFTLPATITASLDVTTTIRETANNKLLGANIAGFSSSTEKALIRKFDPVTVRFPSGVWINWYDWEVDGNRIYDDYVAKTYQGVPDSTYIKMINSNLSGKTGFPGLTALNTEKKLATGKGYDMLWGYNLNYDDNKKSVARLRDSQEKGFEVNYIEMGNEIFYGNQRSNRTSTPQKYVAVAKSLSDTLHSINPNIKVSIPLAWRTPQSYIDYNRILTADTTYFDAVTVHKYVGSDPDEPASFTYKDVIAGRLMLEKDVNYARKLANTKPVWLTEWGVAAGSECQAAAALGMADCYLFLFENQKIYERADWYCVNGLLNSFVTFVGTTRNIKYPLEKTGYGSVHEILRSVFENSTLLQGSMTTTKLSTTIGSTNAISARSVIKDSDTIVFAVNLTNKSVPFDLKFDGVTYTKLFKHEALIFDSLSQDLIMGIDVNPLKLIKSGTGEIILPPYSVNKISINKTYEINTGQRPYKGIVKQIPGSFEGEDYDEGGEGISYHDTSVGNAYNNYRTDSVDIGAITATGGYCIGGTEGGEWVEYTVNVAETGYYDIDFLYSSGSPTVATIGATFEDLGQTLFTGFQLAKTTNWTTYETLTKSAVLLPAGTHILRITVEQRALNIDRIAFRANPNASTRNLEVNNRTVAYPNPSNTGIFQLKEAANWEVYTSLGQKVLTGTVAKVDLSNQPKGMYLLKSESNSTILFKVH